MFFVTLCDKESIQKTCTLSDSLREDLIVLNTYDKSIGNFSKLFKFRDFLMYGSEHIDPTDIICFIDAFDMLCINYDPCGIEEAFKKMKKGIIIGSEENCGPEHPKIVREYFGEGCNTFLNGGFQIGYKEEFLKLHEYIYSNFDVLRAGLEINRTTEQGIISQVYIKHIFDIGLDTESKLVNNWAPSRAFRELDSFFIHVIRADTGAESFIMTPELHLHLMEYIRGNVIYDKYIDMILNKEIFIMQTQRYQALVQKYSTTSFQR